MIFLEYTYAPAHAEQPAYLYRQRRGLQAIDPKCFSLCKIVATCMNVLKSVLPGSYLSKIDSGFGKSRILNYSLSTKYNKVSAFISTFLCFLAVPCGM